MRTAHIAFPAAFLLSLSLLPAARAETRENPKVSELAHEGYWLKNQEAKYTAAMAMLDKPAPALTLSNWHGKEPTSSNKEGKILLIDFWATWCGPCLAQIPHANEITKKYAGQGVVVFAACCYRGAQTMKKVAEEKGMEYPTGRLSEKDINAWQISFWPTYAIIDRTGKLRAIGLRPEYVEKVLDELLVEQPGMPKQ